MNWEVNGLLFSPSLRFHRRNLDDSTVCFKRDDVALPRGRKERVEDGYVILLQPRNWQLRVIFSFRRR